MNVDDELYRLLPNELSGQAATQLLDCLYALAALVESRYFAQLRQYQSQSDNDDQLSLWDREPPF